MPILWASALKSDLSYLQKEDAAVNLSHRKQFESYRHHMDDSTPRGRYTYVPRFRNRTIALVAIVALLIWAAL